MVGRDRVRNAIGFRAVDKLPLYFFTFGETDIVELFLKPARNWIPREFPAYYLDYKFLGKKRGGYGKREDEWGTIWQFGETVGVVPHLLECPIKTTDQMEAYVIPDPLAPGRLEGFDSIISENPDLYFIALQAGLLFERLYQIRGFNETLIDLYENQHRILRFLDRLVDFQISTIRRLDAELPGKIQGFKATDDWGTQNAMVIDPNLWREVFKPRYRRIIDKVHELGMHFWFHSDGQIGEIIPDLIEIGVDVLDVPQPVSIFGAEKLGKEYSGKVSFCLYIDIQSTLVKGTLEQIEREAEDLVLFCSTKNGSGMIASDYPDGESIGASLRNRRASLQAFKKAFNKIHGLGLEAPAIEHRRIT